MDRNKIVLLKNKLLTGDTFTRTEVTELILDYCNNKGKDPAKTNLFIEASIQLGTITSILSQVLEDYYKQYHICEVLDKQGNVLLIY